MRTPSRRTKPARHKPTPPMQRQNPPNMSTAWRQATAPLRRNNRLLALYSHNGRWDLRVILAQRRGGHRPFVARGIYPQIQMLYEPTNTAGHDVLMLEGTSLQATPLGPAALAPQNWGLSMSLVPSAWL